MTRALDLAAAIAVASMLAGCAAAKAPPPPVPGGQIGTLTQGNYTCELPGDATGPVGKALPQYDFEVVGGSSYKAGGVRGSYLNTGDQVVMTGGKLKGLKFITVSDRFLRQIDDKGKETGMRCVLTSHNY
ncbi:MAG TPA: hypothetical protein VJQ77_04465 [Novosphingobium sp.]|nr:hypothetical protein [Novosphingobium sp.]